MRCLMRCLNMMVDNGYQLEINKYAVMVHDMSREKTIEANKRNNEALIEMVKILVRFMNQDYQRIEDLESTLKSNQQFVDRLMSQLDLPRSTHRQVVDSCLFNLMSDYCLSFEDVYDIVARSLVDE